MADGRVIVITGASSGIGAALARRLGQDSYRLVLGARRAEELRKVAAEAEADGSPRALAVETDVTRRDDVNRLRDEAIREFGQIDVWVNNAGRGIARPVLELSDTDVDEMITVNVKSALYGMQAAVPHFEERGSGHLINVSSFLGRVPIASIRSVYSAAKAALNSLTANLRMDLAQTDPNIHVSVVMPGLVATEFARNARNSGQAAPPPPSTRMQPQRPEEVSEVIARLIAQPVAEVYTNPASPEIARRYYEDVAAFEAGLASGAPDAHPNAA